MQCNGTTGKSRYFVCKPWDFCQGEEQTGKSSLKSGGKAEEALTEANITNTGFIFLLRWKKLDTKA